MKKIILLSFLISINISSLEQQTPLEEFFEYPISAFNTLKDEHKFYISLYYLQKIIDQNPIHLQNPSINSSKALQFLYKNPHVLGHINNKVINIINEKARISEISGEYYNLKIYRLIFNNFKNKQVTKQLPHPNLFEVERSKNKKPKKKLKKNKK